MRSSLLILLLLAGCGSSKGDGPNPPAVSGNPATPDTPAFNLAAEVAEPNQECPGRFAASAAEWKSLEDLTALADSLRQMPKSFQQVACRVGRFYQLEEAFFATGVTVPGGKVRRAEIGLHPALFAVRPTLSQLVVWKDRQIVEATQRPRFEAEAAAEAVTVTPDDFVSALSYVLAHELGHVANAEPEFFDVVMKRCSPDCDANSWEGLSIAGNLKPGRFGAHGTYCFYQQCDQRIAADALPGLYASLNDSDFVSLYAASNVFEDVAESFAATAMFDAWKWRWKVRVGDQEVLDSAEHWRGTKMAPKRELFTELANLDFPVN